MKTVRSRKHRLLSAIVLTALFVMLLTVSGCEKAPAGTTAEIPAETPVEPSSETAVKTSADPPIETVPTQTSSPRQGVDQVGEIPETFRLIIENNLFYGITACGNRLLKAETVRESPDSESVSHRIRMMDLYGNDLAVYTCSSDSTYSVRTLTVTQDGGFLFVLGFTDRALGSGKWAGDSGFASHVIKCGKDGSLQFDAPFTGLEGRALQYCLERNGCYYFFGTHETPDTKTRGVVSPTEIYALILDSNGSLLKTRRLSGSDYDTLSNAELSGEGFLLSVSSQSDDGDFAGPASGGYPVDWVFTLNDELEIVRKAKETGRDYFDTLLGEKDGAPVYRSEILQNGFDAGDPRALIDYGDFYLVLSEHNTGEFENKPSDINSTWYYTETVYSAYDKNGQMIFRGSADSSPNYDAMLQSFSD